MWIADKAGVKIPDCVYTPNGANAFKKMGAWADAASAHPQPGDLAFFSFVPAATPSSPIQHIGVVVKDNGDGTVTTYEGNTSSDARPHGSQNNGGEFALKVRGYKIDNKRHIWASIVGFGRPVYAGAVASHPATPVAKVLPAFPGPGPTSSSTRSVWSLMASLESAPVPTGLSTSCASVAPGLQSLPPNS